MIFLTTRVSLEQKFRFAVKRAPSLRGLGLSHLPAWPGQVPAIPSEVPLLLRADASPTRFHGLQASDRASSRPLWPLARRLSRLEVPLMGRSSLGTLWKTTGVGDVAAGSPCGSDLEPYTACNLATSQSRETCAQDFVARLRLVFLAL